MLLQLITRPFFFFVIFFLCYFLFIHLFFLFILGILDMQSLAKDMSGSCCLRKILFHVNRNLAVVKWRQLCSRYITRSSNSNKCMHNNNSSRQFCLLSTDSQNIFTHALKNPQGHAISLAENYNSPSFYTPR